MTLRKRAAGALLTVTTAAVAVAVGAAPALASTTLTVKVTGGGTITATTAKTVLTDGPVSVTCVTKGTVVASKATGSIPSATTKGTSPVKVGTTKTLSFNNCTGPLGKVTVKVNKLPYTVQVDSKTNTKGQTDGIISGVNTSVSTTGCSFNVTGSAPGFFTNSSHTLSVTPKLPITPLNKAGLTISGVVGCAGIVKNGDHPTYVATYTINLHITVKSS
jgi:hypothetical protein